MKRLLHVMVALLSLVGAGYLGSLGYQQLYALWDKNTQSVLVLGNAGVRHIAFIMDGNRRWAKSQNLMPWDGHKSGVGPVKEAVRFCLDHGIDVLSLYAFSLENFKRSNDELSHLFDIIEMGLSTDDIKELAQHGVRIRFVGERDRFPARLIKTIEAIETATMQGQKLLVNMLFCYGGRQELCAAAQQLATEVFQGGLAPQEITEECFEQALWTGAYPLPDMVVRTGGEHRLSNFMPWQSAYSELFFVDTYWPAMSRADFESLLVAFERRKRNFGA
ncbi:MAG: Ditrans,polycis-undecaprenyl-diphosphate synthase ((2E,6E)-farnesyl-diphosphate specific) [candidate division TM6 bacterium GW2011_GWF2_43_17]|nr:MAG: Ditrans,polycis-undecaprenyl-diphosphate synthase ((2E,6E)-farnesyl-diphosphate specific) [candidate division TM6 bacterium GW2011_GWF2_43_17]HAU30225.1 di-trans,poly-cis-decaprenylcistransferase [Candidatus Dependentiae bacterium]